jgi:beta-lactamase regulating signal transducer with metallopeptidase domain
MAAVLEQSAQGLNFLLDATVKATVLLAAAGLLSLVLRRQSAAMRHLVWLVALAGIVLMPVLTLVLPGLSVPLGALFPSQVVTAGKADVPAARPAQAAERKSPQPRSSAPAAPVSVQQKPVPVAETPLVTLPAAIIDDAEPPLPWAAWALIAWLAGAAAVAAYLTVGTVGVWMIVRRARRVEGGPWGELMESLCRQFGLARPVRLAVSEQAIIPVAWGFVRPVVLIPRAAEKWPEDRRRIVLLHELAHIKRRDCLTQTLALAACVLYWFNPLAWLAARRLRIEREGACDDLVLAAGSPPADYAGHLLEIVRALHPAARTPLAAVAMAQRSHFESRLRAILDAARNRRAIGRRVALLVVVLGGCLLLPLAACRPQASETAPNAVPAAGREVTSEAEEFIAVIQRTVNSQSDRDVAAWSNEGGPAAVECFNGVLIVSQMPAGHRRVAGLLDMLQRAGAIKADLKETISKEPESEGAARVRGLLVQKIDADFQKTPLSDVLAFLADAAKPGLNIVVDYPHIEGSGVDLSKRVVDLLKVKQKPVEWLLGQVVPADLGWKVGPGYVLVTTHDILQQDLPLGMYKVWGRDGKPLGASLGDHLIGLVELVGVLQRNVSAQQQPGVAAWSDEGGPAAAEYFNGVLLVTQTRTGQARVASFLTRLAEKGAISAQAGKGIEMGAESPEVAQVSRLLAEPIDVEYQKMPLASVLASLGQTKPGLTIRIDLDIAEAGVDLTTRMVTLKVKQVPAGAVLDLILGDDLAYKVDADGILVMHCDKTLQNLVTVAYKVGL